MRSLAFLLFFGLFIIACSDGDSTTDSTTDNSNQDESTSNSTEPLSTDTKYTLTPFTQSPAYEDAEIRTVSYLNDTWEFDIVSETYQLGSQTPDADQKMCANSDKGQHIHLIIDNEPYNARYTSEFSDVVMEPGDYHVLSFLSRSYHESIKSPTAFKALKMNFGNDGYYKKAESINFPMVWYSRPKGTYVGKKNTDKVMLDFYLTNVELSKTGNKVRVNINGEEDQTITEWKPYYIENLPMGKNTITLTLIDRNDEVVDAPFNPVTREFELKADELE